MVSSTYTTLHYKGRASCYGLEEAGASAFLLFGMLSLCTVRRCKFLLKLCLKVEPQRAQVNTRRRCAWSVRTWRASELCTEYDAPHNPHTCRPRACSDQWLRSSARDAWPRPQVEHTHPPGGAGGSSPPSNRGDGAPPLESPSPHTTHSARNNTTSKQPPEALVRQDAAHAQRRRPCHAGPGGGGGAQVRLVLRVP